MFERFTDRARRVVVLAQEEARMLNHNYIGTEHILLGLIHEGEGVAAKALESLGISLDGVRTQVTEIIGARNRLEGQVVEIKKGTVMCQVKVQIAGGAQMESVMTIDSLDELGIKVGDKVRVAVKAVNVLLIKE